jgi:hypothetical protein
MKKGIVIAVAAIVAAIGVGLVVAKTVGVLYGDALVIPYNGTQTAGITAAGALSCTSIEATGGPITLYSRTKAEMEAESDAYSAGDMILCQDCITPFLIVNGTGTVIAISTGAFNPA